MEAFIELQKQIYQLAALAKTGSPDSAQLSEADRLRLQIDVVVSGGSADYKAKLAGQIQELLRIMIGKMTGKHAAIVILGAFALLAGTWGFTAWLEQRKTIQIEELKSKDHVEALKALSLSSSANVEAFKKITEVLASQGEIGRRAVDAIAATNEALLKAAARTSETVIQDTHLTRNEAELLRITPKKKPEVRIAIQRMRVLDINSSDPNELSILISTPDRKAQYRIKYADTLFSADDRKALFGSLDSRELIWMELAFREVDGEVRSVQLIRTTTPPAVADAAADED